MADSPWYRRIGPRRILARLQRALDSFLNRTSVVFFRCDPIDVDQPRKGELLEADLRRYEQWRSAQPDFPWPSRDDGARRFSEGHRPFALFADGEPRCYGWVSVMRSFRLNELNQYCDTHAPMTWIWDCVTPITMRDRGFFTNFLRALRQKYADRELLIYCHARNAASYRAIRRAGFVPWAMVTRFPDVTRVKILQPRFGPDLYVTSRPDRE